MRGKVGTLGKGTLGRLLVIVLPEIEKRGKNREREKTEETEE